MEHPEDKTWIVAIWPAGAERPIGTGIVIDEYRVLTANHVVKEREEVDVRFAFSAETETRTGTVTGRGSDGDDVAVLTLSSPIPHSVRPVALRKPSGASMRCKPWWAHGFPHSKAGNDADGLVGTDAGFGMLRLDTESRFPVEAGFSGAGVWAPDHGAVVAMVCWELSDTRRDGDAFALSVERISHSLPNEKLDVLTSWELGDASADALLQWGWELATDPQLGTHWSPRARGVTAGSERGYRFRGRRRAVQEAADWLVADGDVRGPLVVTGPPGVGKSAVLARVITTADESFRRQLPEDDNGAMALVGSVSCAVHAKGKTALEVGQEIARAVSADPNGELSDVMLAVTEALDRTPDRRFTLVIDALDEAASPNEARLIASSVVRRLVTEGRSVRVVVATRRYDGAGHLLHSLGASVEIDLGDSGYTEFDDVVEYAVACLQLRGAERPGNPYDDDLAAQGLGVRIAQVASGNFLIAGLLARRHGQADTVTTDPSSLSGVTTIETALLDYLSILPGESGVSATDLLTPLAFAEAPGLTIELWAAAVGGLMGTSIDQHHLEMFARGPAANFLVDAASGSDGIVYRLYHQALNDELLKARALTMSRRPDEMKLFTAWAEIGRSVGWASAPAYLLQALPRHAQLAGLIDNLLEDGEFLLHADLRRLKSAAWFANTKRGESIARVLRAAPRAVRVRGQERADYLTAEAALEYCTGFPAASRSFQIPFASKRPSLAVTTFTEHTGGVWAVGSVQIGDRTYVISGSDDRTVKVWDPASGDILNTFTEHTDWVRAVGSVQIGDRTYVISGSDDGTVKVWDPASGDVLISIALNHPVTSVAGQDGTAIIGLDVGLFVLEVLAMPDERASVADERTVTPPVRNPRRIR